MSAAAMGTLSFPFVVACAFCVLMVAGAHLGSLFTLGTTFRSHCHSMTNKMTS